MPRPDNIKNRYVRPEISAGFWNCRVAKTINPKTATTTIVRMKVARSEFTFSTPILANIAVSAANTADSTAQSCHDEKALAFMASDPPLLRLFLSIP